ncbi:uncharacterized protein K460DRAFT_429901 [Cucurbitaria berberidis CBS 394.84]|uniref:Uncharacterized protein n=1 Tax=Cucurbitaria berberidis CBS 394.84 TaxID=1168544 RepID=A0A9P4L8B4_9PLEO|nr:uncharacterized protein K460DRAFT_429901 [Cucurbitaria berberidis CBS 394.84]KAF1845104.1 hypothetical protein K460DRAFT_429901 [Cucurbitaria berberidis CBS 394.84]
MVSFKAITSFLALTILSATANPIDYDGSLIEERDNNRTVTIFYCVKKRFKGTCQKQKALLGQCTNIDSLNDRISSIRIVGYPHQEQKCIWYLDYNCGKLGYDNPSDSNLADGDGKFNDDISSFMCE